MEPEILSIIDEGRNLKLQIGKMVTKHDYPKGNKNLILLGYHSTMVEHHKGGRWFQNDLRRKKSVQYGSL